jgi:hypothetical protein
MRAVILVAIFAVAVHAGTVVYAPVSFCERFGGTTAAGQTALIQNVVTRAAAGSTTSTPAVLGLFNSPMNRKFFNGSIAGIPDYINVPANTNALVTKLTAFFGWAMNCRAAYPTAPTGPTMTAAHSTMSIDKVVWDDFVTQVVNSMLSYNVPAGAGATSDITYAAGLLGQFKKGANTGMLICNQPNCDAASGFAEFTSGTIDGSFAWLAQDGTNTVSVPKGSNVHWNIGSIHNVVQSDANWEPMATPTFTSGNVAATQTYTWNVGTADATYYFVCMPHKTLMRGKIIVGSGGLSGAASLSASVAVVLSAIAAAVALRF